MSREDKTANFFKSIDDFVAFSGGDHAIGKILVANNGIGATKPSDRYDVGHSKHLEMKERYFKGVTTKKCCDRID